ncbi:unnamed protein product [Rhizophagus irregularis]|nr:unnamed protein product [Rhizophagus irregularis]
MGCSTQRKSSPRIDQDFHEMFHIFVLKISDWSSPKVYQLYGLGETDDPPLGPFQAQSMEMKHRNYNTLAPVGVTEVEDEEMNANFFLRTSVGM